MRFSLLVSSVRDRTGCDVMTPPRHSVRREKQRFSAQDPDERTGAGIVDAPSGLLLQQKREEENDNNYS